MINFTLTHISKGISIYDESVCVSVWVWRGLFVIKVNWPSFHSIIPQ